VRRNVINTRIVGAWEQKAHINDNDVVIVLDSHHVLANTHFAKSTNRDNSKHWARSTWLLGLISEAKLPAAVAVINRLVDRHVDNVLRRLHVHRFTGASLRTKHFTLTGTSVIEYGIV